METGKLHEAKEVLDVVFPSGDESAEAVHPGEQPFHSPAAAVTPQFAAVLGLASLAPIRRDQLDVVLFGELFVEFV